MTVAENARVALIYAPTQNAFYTSFAKRIFLACREAGIAADLVDSSVMHELPLEKVRDANAFLINPRDLIQDVPDRGAFYKVLSRFRSRVMVLAEAVETKWFSFQFTLPMKLDALIDVGFVSQEGKMKELGYSGMPYRFLFNGLSQRERAKVTAVNPAASASRPIPWAFVGHKTIERVEFARWLAEEVDPRGVVFLPDQGRGVRPGSGAVSPMGMDLLLQQTRNYVWVAHHEFAYYESFRFREAVLNGAVPLKLDRTFYSAHSSVPGVVWSHEDLARLVEEQSYEQAYEKCRAYYLDHKGLEDGLREVLLHEI